MESFFIYRLCIYVELTQTLYLYRCLYLYIDSTYIEYRWSQFKPYIFMDYQANMGYLRLVNEMLKMWYLFLSHLQNVTLAQHLKHLIQLFPIYIPSPDICSVLPGSPGYSWLELCWLQHLPLRCVPNIARLQIFADHTQVPHHVHFSPNFTPSYTFAMPLLYLLYLLNPFLNRLPLLPGDSASDVSSK